MACRPTGRKAAAHSLVGKSSTLQKHRSAYWSNIDKNISKVHTQDEKTRVASVASFRHKDDQATEQS
eukprot:3787208-Amphidinium_carterae.1